MKRLLFIDTYSESGHNAFNRVFLTKLAAMGFAIDVAMKEGYWQQLELSMTVGEFSIPLRFYEKRHGRLSDRYYHTLLLLYIKQNIKFVQYDAVLMSSFDEIPLFLANCYANSFLVLHANVGGLTNPIKRIFVKRIAQAATLIAFAEFIKVRCLKYDIANVVVEPQGIAAPYTPLASQKHSLLCGIDARLVSANIQHIIFAPSGAKYQDTFIQRLIDNQSFLTFLAANKIMLVVKGVRKTSITGNVMLLNRALTRDEYQMLFISSLCIVLSYPHTFDYRVSAILHECFSNHIPCILSDIEGFRAFSGHFKYCPYFDSMQEFLDTLGCVISMDKDTRAAPYINLDLLEPRFSSLAMT